MVMIGDTIQTWPIYHSHQHVKVGREHTNFLDASYQLKGAPHKVDLKPSVLLKHPKVETKSENISWFSLFFINDGVALHLVLSTHSLASMD